MPATNTFTPTATSSVTPPPGGSLITYYYDPLYRLTAANYTNGTYFHYTYDAVGNRLSEVSNAGTVNYAYDIANRLTSVGGVTYTWDNNGNLLSDGAWTYSYSHANRLIRAEPAGAPRTYFSYGYNGLGDRLSQAYTNQDLPSVSSVTEYVADLNAGLTQVLSETTTTNGFPSTSTYLYGVGRIGEEQTAGWQYHLGDPLGSVRQLTNPAAAVTLTSSYEPFGDTLLSAGSAATTMQFTGEQRDGTGLTYLRARYYAGGTGRFAAQDAWDADPNRPMTYNLWLYAYANPVNLTDPAGLKPIDCLQPDLDCPKGRDPREVRLIRFLERRTSPSQAPPDVGWNPAIAVGPPSQVVGTQFGQIARPGQRLGPNLCGWIALEMVLESGSREPGLLNAIYEVLSPMVGLGTQNAGDLAKTLVRVGALYPPRYGDRDRDLNWAVRTHVYSANYIWRMDANGDPQAYEEGPQVWHSLGDVRLSERLRSMVSMGHYVIPLVTIKPKSGPADTGYLLPRLPNAAGGHWVVLTGFSDTWDRLRIDSPLNWIRIRNPFSAGLEEFYTWREFEKSWFGSRSVVEASVSP